MSAPKKLTLHNDSTILNISLWLKLIGWVLLAVYMISFVNQLQQLFGGGISIPSAPLDILMFIANLLYTPALGGFYYLICQAAVQGLYLALDIYADNEDDME